MQQLATLAQVKLWIPKLTSSDDDPLLKSLLARASGIIMAHLSRTDVAVRTVTETINGQGGPGILLREWPVVSVSSLSINGLAISAASNAIQSGYVWSTWDGSLPGGPQSLAVRGRSFPRGQQNVSIVYRAGYMTINEPHIIVAGSATTLDSNGSWCSDQGVTYSDGVPLVRVSAAPAIGQYRLNATTPGVYDFNVLENGEDVLISYGYVPAPLAQACVQMIGEWYRYRNRIGQKSVSLDGKETAAFDNSIMTDAIRRDLQPYRRVTL